MCRNNSLLVTKGVKVSEWGEITNKGLSIKVYVSLEILPSFFTLLVNLSYEIIQ
jgi:hypothetical protein